MKQSKLATIMNEDYKMFKFALELAITAPNKSKSQECIEMAINISKLFPLHEIERAKKEVAFYINNLTKQSFKLGHLLELYKEEHSDS